MSSGFLKALILGFFLLALAVPSFGQNTKGDKPASSRDTRFKKSEKKKKPLFGKRSKRSGSAVEGYKPRQERSRRGEVAHKPVTPLRNTDPNAPGRSGKVKTSRNRITSPRKNSQSARNIWPQNNRYVNNPHPKPQKNTQRAVSNRSTLARLKRLQGSDPKPKRRARVIPSSASGSFRPGKSINIMARYPRPKKKGEKAHIRDIAGRKIRTKNYESPKPKVIKSQGGGNAISMTGRDQRSRVNQQRYGRYRNYSSAGRVSRSRRGSVSPMSISGAQSKVYPQSGRFVNNPSKRPRAVQQPQSNRGTLQRLKKLQGSDPKPRRRGIVVPRSASGSFIARKSTNTWAHFPRPKRKGERPYLRDIAGRKLRTKNYETPRPKVIAPSFKPYQGRKRVGERPYKGPATGTHVSRTQTGRAWKGDPSGRRIRTRPGTGGDRVSRSISGGYQSRTRHGETRPGKYPVPVKVPRVGGMMKGYRGNTRMGKAFMPQGEGYTGSIKARKPLRGGGSRSGKLWNNNGTAVQNRIPDRGQGEGYSGNLKGGRPLKGGGSRSGRLWNNKGFPIQSRIPERSQGELYSGSVKARRPVKGGGSRSGRLWNNNGNAVQVRTPRSDAPGLYQGNIKTSRRPKGGGSVSGKLWNNRQSPVLSKVPPKRAMEINGYPGKMKLFSNRPGFSDQGEEYTGHIKARRPVKGGGSVSGKLWNNRQQAIAARGPSSQTLKAGAYQGTLKAHRPVKGGGSVSGKLWNNNEKAVDVRTPKDMRSANAAGNYTGNLKARRPLKGGGSVSGKLWNNKEKPIDVRTPKDMGSADAAGNYTGTLKVSRFKKAYVKNPNASEDAQKKKRPEKGTYLTNGLQIKVARRDYVKNENASALAIRKLKPTKTTMAVGGLQQKVKQYNYVRNNSGSDQALKVREPGKAFARSTDYQGNIRMQKFKLFEKNRELHPDAKFVKINKNNVAEEKDVLTNFKLWWSRLFRKSETQPDHLKDKTRRPRYDKGEAGLWYD